MYTIENFRGHVRFFFLISLPIVCVYFFLILGVLEPGFVGFGGDAPKYMHVKAEKVGSIARFLSVIIFLFWARLMPKKSPLSRKELLIWIGIIGALLFTVFYFPNACLVKTANLPIPEYLKSATVKIGIPTSYIGENKCLKINGLHPHVLYPEGSFNSFGNTPSLASKEMNFTVIGYVEIAPWNFTKDMVPPGKKVFILRDDKGGIFQIDKNFYYYKYINNRPSETERIYPGYYINGIRKGNLDPDQTNEAPKEVSEKIISDSKIDKRDAIAIPLTKEQALAECQRPSDASARGLCIRKLAVTYSDPSLCPQAGTLAGSVFMTYCYEEIAIKNHDVSLCSKITDPTYATFKKDCLEKAK